jgi:hypothetical protein
VSVDEFQALLAKVWLQFKAQRKGNTQADLAEKIGISLARFNHILNHGGLPLNELNCLRLALVPGAPPPEVILRAAGKLQFADVIAQLFGKSRLTAEQIEIIAVCESFPTARQRAAAVEILKAFAREPEVDDAGPVKRPAATRTTRRSRKR